MHILILGANSDVAHAVAKRLACTEKADLYLASRDLEQLESKARDIRVRCDVQVNTLAFDATDTRSHADFYNHLNPKPDGVVLATMGCRREPRRTLPKPDASSTPISAGP